MDINLSSYVDLDKNHIKLDTSIEILYLVLLSIQKKGSLLSAFYSFLISKEKGIPDSSRI